MENPNITLRPACTCTDCLHTHLYTYHTQTCKRGKNIYVVKTDVPFDLGAHRKEDKRGRKGGRNIGKGCESVEMTE